MASEIHELAGRIAPESFLIDPEKLVSAYYTGDLSGPVSFGTSGHRGTSLKGTFNELHIAATSRPYVNTVYQRGLTALFLWG
jgi:phosphoglucomutase